MKTSKSHVAEIVSLLAGIKIQNEVSSSFIRSHRHPSLSQLWRSRRQQQQRTASASSHNLHRHTQEKEEEEEGDNFGNRSGRGSMEKKRLIRQYEDAARNNRLDLVTAAKLLFSAPEKPKKFGWDFHLWQFFVACLPPLAVYLCAQLIRSDRRRFEKEKELAKAERMQGNLPTEHKPYLSNEQDREDSYLVGKFESLSEVPKDFLDLKARLDALEEKIRHMEDAAERSSKSIGNEKLLKFVTEDQENRAAVIDGSPKEGLGEKKEVILVHKEHSSPSTLGLSEKKEVLSVLKEHRSSSTFQDKQTKIQDRVSSKNDGKVMEQQRASTIWSFWRDKDAKDHTEHTESKQENSSQVLSNANSSSQIKSSLTIAKGNKGKGDPSGINPEISTSDATEHSKHVC